MQAEIFGIPAFSCLREIPAGEEEIHLKNRLDNRQTNFKTICFKNLFLDPKAKVGNHNTSHGNDR